MIKLIATEDELSIFKNTHEAIIDEETWKVDTDNFLKMIEKYTDIEELTVPIINEYIEKVVVHEATGGRKGKDRKQQVDVYFNFIGNCQVPQKVDIEKWLKNGRVYAVKTPEIVSAILDGDFFKFTCHNCNHMVLIDYPTVVVDEEQKTIIQYDLFDIYKV